MTDRTEPDSMSDWITALSAAKMATFPRQPWAGEPLEVTTVQVFHHGTAPSVAALLGLPGGPS